MNPIRMNNMVRLALSLPLLLFNPSSVHSECCNKKEVAGTNSKSGVYWLENSSESGCSDGCVYSKENESNQLYCFRSSNIYVIECSNDTKPDVWLNQVIIEPKSITAMGTYGSIEYCPQSSYVTGLELEVAPLCQRRCIRDDDVALMGIRLYCANLDDTSVETASVTSDVLTGYVRRFGGSLAGTKTTTKQSCSSGNFLESAQYLSQFFISTEETNFSNFTCPTGIICSNINVARFDPIGGMNLNVRCSDSTVLNGAGTAQTESPDDSSWSDWKDCPTGYVMCGIQSRLSTGDGTDSVHNLGHTGVRFVCCELPAGYI